MTENDMSHDSAAELAAAYGNERYDDLGYRQWAGTRFPGGWLMSPQGDDLEWQTGVVCLVVLDDGQIFEDSSSLPPGELARRYSTADGG